MSNCILCGDIISKDLKLCDNELCILQSNSLPLDNFVVDYIRNNKEESNLLFMLYINSEYKDIFIDNKPFNNDKIIEDYENIITDLKNLFNNEINLFENKIDKMEITDSMLHDMFISPYTYELLKFTFKNINMEFKYDSELVNSFKKYEKEIKVYTFHKSKDSSPEFYKKENISNIQYLFHGSNNKNWFSILFNGLKNYSGTSKMCNGNSYGNGIYLSNSIELSFGYSRKNLKCLVTKEDKEYNKLFFAVFEVIDSNSFKKGFDVYVVNNEQYVRISHLIQTSYRFRTNDLIEKYFTKSKTEITKSFTDKKINIGNKRLMIEYSKIKKNEKNNKDFILHDTETLTSWQIDIINIDNESLLYKDMQNINIHSITIEIKFDLYPINPPFVRIIKPVFKRMTGHVTLGGSICYELLTNQGWSPAFSIESLIISIKSIISIDGRLENNQSNSQYNINNALLSFNNVKKAHGWN